jgi:hypothetical protein
MKFFAAICGTAALVTAFVNHRTLSLFHARYGALETPLPDLTRAILWKGGIVSTSLLVASAVVVFAGLLRKNSQVMLAGGIATIVLMLGAATLVPAALMLPMEKILLEGGSGTTRPKPAAAPVEKDSIRD